MSPKTKRRRRRRRNIAAVVRHLKSKPRKTDMPFVRIYARSGRMAGDMCFNFALTKWQMRDEMLFTYAPTSYGKAAAQIRGEL